MKGFAGPKPAEIRIGLGVDRSITSEVVPTASQAGAYAPSDKQNNGYSGTPMWKLALERAQREQAAGTPAVKIPDGFKPIDQVSETLLPLSKRPASGMRWYYSEKRSIFWSPVDLKLYVLDPNTRQPAELHEAVGEDLRVAVGACFHESAVQARHILVKDLSKAAQALRISIDHLDKPCAIYALYEGHRGKICAASGASGTKNTCADFCQQSLHQKLLLKLATFRGYWDDRRLEATMRESFEELDSEFAAKHPSEEDGCCAAVALITGRRLVIASVGDVACVVCRRDGEALVPLKAHVARGVDDEDEDEDEEDEPPNAGAEPSAGSQIRWTRALGDQDFKKPGSSPRLTATPDVSVVYLDHRHRGMALVCRALYNAIGRGTAVSTVFKRSQGRPRMASGALTDAAVQWLGAVGGDMGLGSVVAFFEGLEPAGGGGSSGSAAASAAKRRKTETPSQVRLRHILVKHKESKSTTDKVRNKQVKRTRGEAERILRAVLEECEVDTKNCAKAFTQRCRELSECTTSQVAGDLAGDLGWVRPGKNEQKFGPSFDSAAFSLQVGQLSDLIDSDQGVHILIRAA